MLDVERCYLKLMDVFPISDLENEVLVNFMDDSVLPDWKKEKKTKRKKHILRKLRENFLPLKIVFSLRVESVRVENYLSYPALIIFHVLV